MMVSGNFIDELKKIASEITELKKYQVKLMTDKNFVDHINNLDKHFQNYSEIWLAGHFSNAFVKKVRNISKDTIKNVDFRIMSIDPKANKSNKKALDDLKKMGANVIIHPHLHARLFIGFTSETQEMVLIIGSYDYNREGLSGDKDNLGITTNNPELVTEAREFYLKLWNQISPPKKKPFLLQEDFSEYNIGDQLRPEWNVNLDEGTVQVVEARDAPWQSKKCVMIKNGGANTHILYRIPEFKKGIIDYWIKLDKEFNDYGSPLIVMSPDSIKRITNEDNRIIYMDITRGKLRRDSGSKDTMNLIDIIDIDPDKWYNIKLNIDCTVHSYDLTVDDKTEKNLVFPAEFKSIYKIRTKYGFGKDIQWKTYIGNIIIQSKE